MAGKIVADTLEHSTAGSIATNYVVNGSAKAWCIFDGGAGTLSLDASLNTSSLTDVATGSYYANYVNNMSSVNYFADGDGDALRHVNTETTSSDRNHIRVYNSSNAAADVTGVRGAVLGDLA